MVEATVAVGIWLVWTPFGAVAQLGERLDRTQEVRGSSPLSSIVRSEKDAETARYEADA